MSCCCVLRSGITKRPSGTVDWSSAATLLRSAYYCIALLLICASLHAERGCDFHCTLHLQAPMSTQSKPVYANFSVYKGKAALSLKVGPTRPLMGASSLEVASGWLAEYLVCCRSASLAGLR